jgi:hypothetical protein
VPRPEPTDEFRESIIDRVEAILCACEECHRPIEVEPARSDLFDLFALSEEAGGLAEGSSCDLTADALCQSLASRWGLKSAAQSWMERNTSIPPAQMARMRGLWSVMRMWMEWTYAWERWSEFHAPSAHESQGEGGDAGAGRAEEARSAGEKTWD